jgi:hypothetical protein
MSARHGRWRWVVVALLLLAGLAIVMAVPHVRRFIAVDRFLDAGGVYDDERDSCTGATH